MKKNTAIIFFLVVFQHSFGQIEDVMAIPSTFDKKDSFNRLIATPEVSLFHKVNFLPINLYTGKPDVEIPLYTIKTGDIEIPISLKYDIGANKVEEIASNVGWGWSLQSGGSLTKIVRDIDDHDFDSEAEITPCRNNGTCDDINLQFTEAKVLRLGYLRRLSDKLSSIQGSILSNLSDDALPDLFLVQAPGLSSRFHLERNFSQYSPLQPYKAILLDGSSVKIEDVYYNNFNVESIKDFAGFNYKDAVPNIEYSYIFSSSNNGVNADNPIYQIRGFDGLPGLMRTKSIDYGNFNISNEKGIKYQFSTFDINESAPVFYDINSSYWRGDNHVGYPNLRHFGSTYKIKKGAWHLDRIKDTNNKEVNFTYKPVFTFEYEKQLNYMDLAKTDINEVNKIYNNLETGVYYNFIANTGPFWGAKDTPVAGPPNNYNEDPQYVLWKGVDPFSENMYKTTQQQILDKITWEKGEVLFFYDLQRKDKINPKALTEIKVKNNAGDIIKHYSFNYSYFKSSDAGCLPETMDTKCYRLKLDKINDLKINPQGTQGYTFKYNESINIPRIDSKSKDFMGYYNGQSNSTTNIPSFTFSPNKRRLSIIPFQSNAFIGNEFIKINGEVNISPTNYSLNGLLTKITYPTGGSAEFDYENNMFNFYNFDILSPGARIKHQILDDEKGNKIIKKYKYTTTNGKSSGGILNFPKIADLMLWNSGNKNLTFQTYNYSKANIELTQNSYVGYARVIEEIEGNGKTEYIFNDANQYPNEYEYSNDSFFSKHSFYPGRSYTDFDNRRGTLSHKYIYDNNGVKLLEENYNYANYKAIDSKFRIFKIGTTEKNNNGYYIPKKEVFTVQILNSINRPSYKEVIEYLNDKKLISKTEYLYNSPKHLYLTEQKTTFPDGNYLITSYNKYPQDTNNTALTLLNKLDTPLETISSKTINGITKILSKTETVYNTSIPTIQTGNLVLPLLVRSFDIENAQSILSTTETTYDKYDAKGNLQQYTTKDGISTTIIWGYNQTQPIAKIENAKLADINSSFINAIVAASETDATAGTNNDETNLLNAFKTFKDNLPGYKITTYSYDPLIGVRSITPPSGIRESYLYDSAGRLEKVINADGNLLKEFKYNYKQ
ncbi:hypothetical protein C1637_22465 [Chryseobacterium lactis]|uniref:RHS repeat protein n=1 Tax=Chryseobacterium lactis TaxID=1241981 RepID=A0A3G6RMS2_CHRLC|nr:RHS repeat domain-containing protein [Chryseobacterium lactis]AZA80556.1 hypothetical protein EG342_00870 [Chryseobacterium lactis]AZB05558.1 hypothetical protein EG341_16995 [Chryseobacterium lactis]PNW11308.1 hypothetical protein C1637_22465 [Chryseobacterium lactis]